MSELSQWILLGVIFAICLYGVHIYIQWCFIQSAVRSGTKDAIKETLINTGLLEELMKQNKEYKNTSESVSEPK